MGLWRGATDTGDNREDKCNQASPASEGSFFILLPPRLGANLRNGRSSWSWKWGYHSGRHCSRHLPVGVVFYTRQRVRARSIEVLPLRDLRSYILVLSARLSAPWRRVQGEITSVNDNWRNIACSSPELWNSVLLTIRGSDWRQSALRLIWQTSNLAFGVRNLPLNIRLHYIAVDLDTPQNCLSVMEAFCREASRWKHICIVGHAELFEHISSYTSEVAAGAHQLSSLYLHSTPCFPEKYSLSIGSSDAPLPSPSHLSLTNIAIEINTSDLSWLTSLCLPAITVTKIIHILTRASSLNKLTTGIAPPELAESNSFQDWDSSF